MIVFKIIGAAILGGILGLAEATDPSQMGRIITGVIQGVGFIGGGLIIKEGQSAKGLTSAASVWVSALLGLACGIGAWHLAIVSLLTTLLILRGVRLFHRKESSDE